MKSCYSKYTKEKIYQKGKLCAKATLPLMHYHVYCKSKNSRTEAGAIHATSENIVKGLLHRQMDSRRQRCVSSQMARCLVIGSSPFTLSLMKMFKSTIFGLQERMLVGVQDVTENSNMLEVFSIVPGVPNSTLLSKNSINSNFRENFCGISSPFVYKTHQVPFNPNIPAEDNHSAIYMLVDGFNIYRLKLSNGKLISKHSLYKFNFLFVDILLVMVQGNRKAVVQYLYPATTVFKRITRRKTDGKRPTI